MSLGETNIPVSLERALETGPAPVGRWDKVLAPHYIGLFLWIVFFDQLARGTLAVGGLFASLQGAFVGGLLAFGLLYLVPAWLGQGSRKTLEIVSSGTFAREALYGFQEWSWGSFRPSGSRSRSTSARP